MNRGRRTGALIPVLIVVLLGWTSSVAHGWDAVEVAKHDTIKLQTNCPGEGPYSFPVWVVEVDGHVFVRLGSRAAGRVECTSSSTLGVDVGLQHYEVRGIPSPGLANKVAAAMAAKYSSDVLVRWFPHPLTLCLDP